MNQAHRHFEVRCPIHGFIDFNDWERAVIAHPVFQRLRRIRQLGLTEYIYPGATHTRFEHSLGVMHTATRMYDALRKREGKQLKEEFAYDDAGFGRDRQLVRFSALLHDVGHGPFSHVAEELMPMDDAGKRFEHEHYSAAIIRTKLKDVIEKHPLNDNYRLQADEIANLLEGKSRAKRSLFWREALTGQLDADRMDYLLRDSHHAGVQYGRFDLERIISTLTIAPGIGDSGARLAVSEGGLHAAESVILARYFMFTQVYFHKTRLAYDVVVQRLLAYLLPDGKFPKPDETGLDDYLKWDDWHVLGGVAAGRGGSEGKMLLGRDHPRAVYQTPELAKEDDLAELKRVRDALGAMVIAEQTPSKSWYKVGTTDIPIVSRDRRVLPLSRHSSVVENLKVSNQALLYVKPEDVATARAKINEVTQS